MIVPALVLLLAILFLAGRIAGPESPDLFDWETAFHQLLTGLAVVSAILFLLMFAGHFRWPWILACLSAAILLPIWYRGLPSRRELQRTGILIGIAVALTLSLYKWNPPFEAVIGGDDASVYIAAAEQLAHEGCITYTDELVTRMTPDQRESFFRNRFREDWTGPYIRFAGGLRLFDPDKGQVRFGFYHLHPVWLAFAILLFGEKLFLLWISLVAVLVLLTLFFLGKRSADFVAGIALAALLFVFYPVHYFLRFPMSESLAMLLFLGGLLSFLRIAEEKSGTPPRLASLLSCGMLWGASFLCRVDCLYLTLLFLLVCFSAVPAFAQRWRNWLPLLRVVAVFALLAGVYQFAGGEYENLFTNRDNLRVGLITDLALEVVTSATQFISAHTFLAASSFIALSAIILFFPVGGQTKSPATPGMLRLRGAAGILLAATMLSVITGFPPNFRHFASHVGWFFPYAPPLLFAFPAVGAIILFLTERRKPSFQALTLLLLLTCAMYLFRPLIYPEQPWVMRRFVPILIPVFFLMGLAGWSRVLAQISRIQWIRGTAVALLAALGIFFLLPKSRYLFTEPILRGVLSQIDLLASKIPKGALLLVPDRIAGTHLGIALRYRHGIDILLLPVDTSTGRRFSSTVRSFIDAERSQRPVLVLSMEESHQVYPIGQFYDLEEIEESGFSFGVIRRVSRLEYPSEVFTWNFNTTVYSLAAMSGPLRTSISYEDEESIFLNFHQKEQDFRWTRDYSVLTDFQFPVKGKEVEITLSVGPISPWLRLEKPDVILMANYSVRAEFTGSNEYQMRFRIPANSLGEIHALSIRTPTFLERPEGRNLGLSFTGLTLKTVGD